VSLTFTANITNTWAITLYPAGTTNAAQSTGVLDQAAQGSAVFYGAQVELGSAATSYIPTTTAAVTRNADVLTYPSAGNIDGTVGWCSAEVASIFDGAKTGNRYFVDVSAPSGNRPVLWDASGTTLSLFDGTGVRSLVSYTPSTAGKKIVSTWGGTSSQGAVSGAVGSAQSFDGDLNVGAAIGIGGISSAEPYACIRNVRIGQLQLSASEAQAVTR
jgi:hypothetical protein